MNVNRIVLLVGFLWAQVLFVPWSLGSPAPVQKWLDNPLDVPLQIGVSNLCAETNGYLEIRIGRERAVFHGAGFDGNGDFIPTNYPPVTIPVVLRREYQMSMICSNVESRSALLRTNEFDDEDVDSLIHFIIEGQYEYPYYDLIREFVWTNFTSSAQGILATSTIPVERMTNLVCELNRVLSGPCVYESERIYYEWLSATTLNLLAENPQEGERLILLNRWLLWDVFGWTGFPYMEDSSGPTLVSLSVSLPREYHLKRYRPIRTYSIFVDRGVYDGNPICIERIDDQEMYTNTCDLELTDKLGRWYVDDGSKDAKPAPGDGSWLSLGPGATGDTNRIGIDWSVSLGRTFDGLAAGRLRIRESGLSREISTPACLYYNAASTNIRDQVEIVSTNLNGDIRQVKAYQTFVDVLAADASEISLRFYHTSDVTTNKDCNGIYTNITGQPFVTWTIQNPEPETTNKLLVVEERYGARITNSLLKTMTGNGATWTLRYGNGDEERVETREVTFYISDGVTHRQEVNTIRNGDQGLIAYQCTETYRPFPWGWELIRSTVPGDPEQVTSYAYYTQPSEHGYTQIKSIEYPDGYWEKRIYNDLPSYPHATNGYLSVHRDLYANGLLRFVLRPRLDSIGVTPENATPDNTMYTAYGYGTTNGWRHAVEYDGVLRTIVHNKLSYCMDEFPVPGATYSMSWINLDPSIGNAACAQSISEHSDNAFPGLAGHPAFLHQSSLGRANIWYYYAHGIFDSQANEFVMNETNHAYFDLQAITNKYPDHCEVRIEEPFRFGAMTIIPEGVAINSADDYLIPFSFCGYPKKSRKAVLVYHSGNLVLEEDHVLLSVDELGEDPQFALLNKTRYFVDTLGRATNVVRIDAITGQPRTLQTADYRDASGHDGELLRTETDETGGQKIYDYDSLKRVRTLTIKGYGGQPDRVITNRFDAFGRLVNVTTNAAGLLTTESWAYDLGGRVTNHIDSSGICVATSFDASNRITTNSYPGSVTVIQERYVDRQPKSVQGSATVSQYYTFSNPLAAGANREQGHINAIQMTTNMLGAPTLMRWTATGRNIADLDALQQSPVGAGTSNLRWTIFNYPPSQEGVVDSVHYSPGSLPVHYGYLGALVASEEEEDGDYQRHSWTNNWYVQIDGIWYNATTNCVAMKDESEDPTIVGVTLEQVNGFEGAEIARTCVYDADTNLTVTTTYLDRGQNKIMSITSQPATSSLSATNIVQSGLLMQSSTLSVASPTRYYYDALGRTNRIQDALGFSTWITYDPVHGRISSITDSTGQTTGYDYYGANEANAGKLRSQTDANGKKTRYAYTFRGELYRVWGETPYPAEYRYNQYGELTNLITFRNGTGWSGAQWPTSPGTGDNTYWIYDQASGALLQKKDAEGRTTEYRYDSLTGKLATRSWQRTTGGGAAVTVTNIYNRNGDLVRQDYNDGTPSVLFKNFSRIGLPREIVDATGTNILVYDHAGRVTCSTNIADNGLLGHIAVASRFDPRYGRDELRVYGNNWRLTNSFAYDAYGRLQKVEAGEFSATYGYLPNSDLLQTTTCKSNTVTVLTTTRAWEFGMRLAAIYNQANGATIGSHVYQYDLLNRRVRATLEDGSYWRYGYNDRNELIEARRHWTDQSPAAGQQFGFAYDHIGNRTSAHSGGDMNGANQRRTVYTANALNQYTSILTPGYEDICGVAIATNGVTVNGLAADRKCEYFHREIPVPNTNCAVWQSITVSSAGTEDSGGLVFPPNAPTLTYDEDGNLRFDGVWNYEWDGENRLKAMWMTTVSGIPQAQRLRLELAYDYMGRRAQKVVKSWSGESFGTTVATERFVYDGWNVVAILNGSLGLEKSLVWGQDLSGTMEQAGGIGGLILASISGTNAFVGYDGNGNITALIDAGNKSTAAAYEYGPFGELIRATGPLGHANPFRWSTKFWDEETGLVYYGFRYYSPGLGRWIGREPSVDQVFHNLYLFCGNNAICRFDLDGRFWSELWDFTKGLGVVLTGTASGALSGWVTSGFNPAGAVAGAVAGTANGLLALMVGWANGDSWGSMYGRAAITGALSGFAGGMAAIGSGWTSIGLGALGGGVAGAASSFIYGGRSGSSILRGMAIGMILGAGAGYAGQAEDAWLDGVLAFASESGGNTVNGYIDLFQQ